MKKTLLHRIFGFGRIPKKLSSSLHSEGIVLLDEGIGGSITFIKFKAPGRYHSFKRNWFTGSIVLTGRSFAAFSWFKPLVFLPLDHQKFSELRISIEPGDKLFITYDASVFNEKWSGTVECRFKTSKAQMFLEHLLGAIKRVG